jgi:polysaccharide biosynthesis protein PslG
MFREYIRQATVGLIAICFATVASATSLAHDPVMSNAIMGNRDTYPLPTGTTLAEGAGLCGFKNTEADFTKIANAGYRWTRIECDWHVVETVAGQAYNFTVIDGLVSAAISHGLRPMVILNSSQPKYGTGAVDTPEEIAGYANFAAAVVNRHKNKGILWELWNEPHVSTYWHGTPNATNYMSMVHAAVAAIRAQSPDEWIVGASTGLINLDYLRTCVAQGLLNDIDAITVHPYNGTFPEANGPYFDTLRLFIEQSAPVGKSIPIFVSEDGVDNATASDLRTQYAQREPLFNLVQGIPLTFWFNYCDFTDTNLNLTLTYGLLDLAGNPRPAYYALVWLRGALAGYTYELRLDTGSASDFVLLFSNGTTQKLVAWTTGSAHTVSLPGISGLTFSAQDKSNSSTINAASGLVIPVGNHPIILTPQTANANLDALVGWPKLPASAVITSRLDVSNLILSALVNTNWSNFPTGTTLKVEDIPDALTGWNRANATWTLSNLTTLTPSSASVFNLLNDLPRIQDRLEGGHTIRLTIQLPGGATFTQSTILYHRDAARITLLPAVDNLFHLQVENPSGRAINGTITVTNSNGTVTQTQPIVMATNQAIAYVNFSSITKGMFELGVRVKMFDTSNNLVYPANPIATSMKMVATHFSTPQNQYLSVVVFPTASPVDTVTASFPTSSDIPGIASSKVVYDVDYNLTLTQGTRYFGVNAVSAGGTWDPISSQSWNPSGFTYGLWVNGDNSNVWLQATFADAGGEKFQLNGPRVTWTGWKYVTFTTTQFNAHWGGNNNAVMDGNITLNKILLVDPLGVPTNGSLRITGSMTLVPSGA